MMYNDNHSRKTEIIAHRGASWDAPENTLTAIRRGWEYGADSVEIDVHCAGDGRIMVIHDPTTERTTGTNLTVRTTPSTELRTLDAGALKSPEYAGERIPFLEEVLAELPEGKGIIIEIKCGAEILPPLRELLGEGGYVSRMVIMSFDPGTAVASKRFMPQFPVFWLISAPKRFLTGTPLPHPQNRITQALEMNLDGLSAQYTGITAGFAEKTHAAGLKLFTWTVNDDAVANRLAALGVDGIITDRPGWIREKLNEG